MNIKKVYMDGYRNILETILELQNITSILSTNNYGKSNLLFAIVFGFNFLQQHPKNKAIMMKDFKCVLDVAKNRK